MSIKTDNLAKAMLRPINTAAIVIMGAYTFVWGFWIFNPFWDVFRTAKIFSYMAMLPEYFWGGLAMAVGIMMVYGVMKHNYKSLMWGAKVGFYHWTMICILYFFGDWQNTGGVTALMISFYCGFIWLNIRVNKAILVFKE